jgi:hypothetical protein
LQLIKPPLCNKLADVPIDVQAILSRAVVASGVISSPTMIVERTRVWATRMMVRKNPPTTLQMKKRAYVVHVALVEHNKAYVSLICDIIPPNSQEALDACIEQAMLSGWLVNQLVGWSVDSSGCYW